MLLLLFQVEGNFYAINTEQVIEIVPMVVLRTVQSAPDYIAGVFNYHETVVPVIDLCRLIRGIPCQICYSTRIIITRNSSETSTDSPYRPGQFGLMAERVTETLTVSDNQPNQPEYMNHSPYLGSLLMTEQGMIQTIHWEALISQSFTSLPTSEKDLVNGARLH